jgi:hypothetical protein
MSDVSRVQIFQVLKDEQEASLEMEVRHGGRAMCSFHERITA